MAGAGPPKGLIVELITPLKRDRGIDDKGLRQVLERVLPHAQGVFLASPIAGEGRFLDAALREELLRKAVPVIKGRTPIFFWITHKTEEETGKCLALMEAALERLRYSGQAFWVDTPLSYRSNRGLASHYRKLSAMSRRPFLLHNDPGLVEGTGQPFKRMNIRTGILKQVSAIEAVHGLLFSGSFARAQNYHRAVRQRKDFRIYDGREIAFLTHPSLSGVVSVGANLSPRAWRRITDSSLHLSANEEGYPDHMRQVWETGEYLRNLMDAYGDQPVPAIKQALFELGIIGDPTCAPETGKTGMDTGLLREWMVRYGECA